MRTIAVLLLTLASGTAFVGPRRFHAPTIVQQVTAAPAAATDFDLKTYLEEKRVAVEKALAASIETTCPETETITESMRYSLLAGGKRIRPIMCIAACEMFGGTMEDAMPTAVAIEMIHTMSLVHDDLPAMDNDSLRRGVPTNHVVFGEDIAILAGDALLSEAFSHCATNTPKSVPAERIVEVLRRLGNSVGPVGLAGGQVMDLQCEGKEGVNLDQLRWIHAHKTAALLQVSVTAGAVLAGASAEDVAALDTYALDVGLAFQVADDILDVTASSDDLGKTAGKDEEVEGRLKIARLMCHSVSRSRESLYLCFFYFRSTLISRLVFVCFALDSFLPLSPLLSTQPRVTSVLRVCVGGCLCCLVLSGVLLVLWWLDLCTP